MHNIVLSEQMLKILSDHLADIEKEKDSIINSFYADNAETGMDIEAFFREYTATVGNYLKSVKVRKDGSDNCPLSIIGSIVEVLDIEDKDIYSYQIVLPYAHKKPGDMSCASCLSPMGKALLLKTAGSRVSIQTPAGVFDYEVLSIALPDQNAKTMNTNSYQSRKSIADTRTSSVNAAL